MNLPRFYPILDVDASRRSGLSVAAAAAEILAGGAKILQYRRKGFFSREAFAELQAVAELCREAAVPLVVNDRADLARMVDAALHLGQSDLTPTDARAMFTGAIGYSTHNEQQLRQAMAEPVDYLALGPIFQTASKENPDPVVGLAELRRLRPLAATRPLVAIGGITRGNARSVIDAGADSVAVIGDVFPADGNLRVRVAEWVRLLSD